MAATIPTGDNAAALASGSGRDPVELLADEFVRRRRQGDRPTIDEYAARFPHLADEIRNVFPALVALEQAGPSRRDGAVSGSIFPCDGSPPPAIGDYRILREIGRGAMGVVYEAEQQSLDRRVALKVLPWHAATSSIAVERFRREARAAARLHHTNIVPVFDVGEEGHVCYYAMQYIPGQPLDRVLVELRKSKQGGDLNLRHRIRKPIPDVTGKQGPVAPEETRHIAPGSTIDDLPAQGSSRWLVESRGSDYFRNVARLGHQVADALAYAHGRGIIHRDIKPSNLLLDTAGAVWVTDFGLAKTEEAGITRTGDLLGTLRYMAPERFRGECDVQADVYSLGATLYELLTLRPAYDGRDSADLIARIGNTDPVKPRSIDSSISRDLELIVVKALDRDRRHRYESAAAMAEDLRRFLGDEPILGRRPPLLERFSRWARHNRTLAAVTMTVAALLVAAAVVSAVASASFQSLASQERAARIETTAHLYRSLVREAEAVRLARREGYRDEVWTLLDRARQLDTPEIDRGELRREAVQSLGDFVGRPPTVLTGFGPSVRSLTLGGDGTIAVGLADGTIRWHAADSGELVGEQQAHFAPVEWLASLADTHTFYSADSRGVIKSWRRTEAGDFQATRVSDVEAPLLALVAVGTDQVITARRRFADDSQIIVQNSAYHGTVTVDPRAPVTAAALSGGGDQLAVASDSELLIYSTRTGALIERTTSELGPLRTVAFSRDGQLLLAGCDEGLVVYDLPELRQQTFMRTGEVPLGTFAPDGTQLAFAGTNRRITLWNFRGNRELAVLTHPGWQDIHSLIVGSDGRRLAAADGHAVRIWNLAGGGERTAVAGHAAGVTDVAFSGDGQRLATGGKDRILALWDTETAEQVAVTSLPAAVQTIALDPTGKLAAAGDLAGNVRLYDGRSLQLLTDVAHSLGEVRRVRFSPDGDLLAVAGDAGLALWRIRTTEAFGKGLPRRPGDVWVELLHQLTTHPVSDLQFGPGKHLLAWRDLDQKLHVAETATGIEWPLNAPNTLRGDQNVAFSKGGQELLFVDRQGRLVVWDVVRDRETLAMGNDRDFPAGLVATNPASEWIAAAQTPLQLAIWSRAAREPLFMLREERATISAASWSSDGRLLAVGTQDGGVAVWNLPAVRQELAPLDLDWNDEEVNRGDVPPAHRTPLEALAEVIEQAPGDKRLLARRGSILMQHGNLDQALADFTQVLESDASHVSALVGRGELYARQERFSQAAADYRRALATQPEHFEHWFAAATLLAMAGETQEYREHCQQMFARYGSDRDLLQLERTVLACLLLPEAMAPSELPLSRLETSLSSPAIDESTRCRTWITLALAAVRGGDSERALANLQRAQAESVHSNRPELQALSFAVLAIAQQDHGLPAAARSSLAASRDFASSGSARGWRVLLLLQAEAQARLAK
jgi:eukaryotic-like serine/threonine-protein kinase